MQKILEIGQDGWEFLFQIPAGLGDHILIRDAFMPADLDFLDESADGSGGFGRREKDIRVEEICIAYGVARVWCFLNKSANLASAWSNSAIRSYE